MQIPKTTWRDTFKKRLKSLPHIHEEERKLASHLSKYLKTQSGTWGIYRAMNSEINVDSVPALASHIRWAYPKMTGAQMQFFIPGPQGFAAGFAGISEPVVDGAEEVSMMDLNGILIPGLGFTQKGVRLGKGQGHYDRVLSNYGGRKIGVTLSPLVDAEIPEDEWDVRMDFLATELAVEGCS